MIASRVDSLFPSGIRAMMALAAERARQGLPVLHMEAGQPNFPTPPHVVEAAVEAARNGFTGYTPNTGISSLRSAVAARVNDRNGLTLDEGNVCITSGAVMGLYLALMAIVEQGDEVLVPDPGWPNYHSAVSMAGGHSVAYPLHPEAGYRLHVENLESLVTPRTRAIMINFPGNPTGAVMPADGVRELLAFAERHDLFVVSDEVYEDFVFDGVHNSILMNGLTDRLIMVSGASKSYAMTGWRLGWLVADSTVVAAAAKLVEPIASCPSSLSQVAAETALRGPQDCVRLMRDAYARAAQHVLEVLQPPGLLPVVPDGAFYALIDVSRSGLTSDAFARRLLTTEGVAVAPGSTFGDRTGQMVRISTACSEDDLVRGCTIIKNVLLT